MSDPGVADRSGSAEPRRARPEEAGAVAALWLRARFAAVPAIPALIHSDAEVHDWFATVVLPEHEVWVTSVGGATSARISALLVLDGNEIDQLYVEPAMQGHGLGTQLIDLAKRRRPEGLRLWTFSSNEGARRFYERQGFVPTGSTDGENEEGEPDVRYEWLPAAGSGP